MVTRIAHLADSHLGYRKGTKDDPETGRNQRSQDFADAFTSAVEQIIARHQASPYSLFIHAGDIFDRPRPDMADVTIVAGAMAAFQAAGIPQVWIGGNHDIARLRTRETALTMLRAIFADERTMFCVERDSGILVLPELIVQGVCWGGWEKANNHLASHVDDRSRPSILVAHGEIDRQYNILDGRERYDTLGERFDYIAAGHLHVDHRVQGSENIVYPGSTERSGWRDAALRTPGWLHAEFDRGDLTFERIAVPARPMIDFGCIDATDCENLPEMVLESVLGSGEEPEMLKRALGRITIENAPARSYASQRAAVESAIGERLWWLQVNFLERGSVFRRGDEMVYKMPSVEQMFETYCEEALSGEPEFARRFLDKGSAALAMAADRLLEVTEP